MTADADTLRPRDRGPFNELTKQYYEAFRAAKPVVTTSDAGGPLEVVVEGRNGRVVEPDPRSVAAALRELLTDEATARSLGTAGQKAAAAVTWDNAIEKLVE
jgi:glycosyltransferase involved in cell wall biosynthesis